MDEWDASLFLQVIQFLNARDAGRVALGSRRCYYLVHQYRIRCGPQLVLGASRSRDAACSASNLLRDAIVTAREQCQSAPQLVLALLRDQSRAPGQQLWHHVLLPKDTVILGATSDRLQVTVGPEQCTYCDDAAVMLLSGLSKEHTAWKPFSSQDDDDDMIIFDNEGRQDWKMFIVYACGECVSQVEEFVRSLQARFPDAVIVGGISTSAFVSTSIDYSLTEGDYYQNFTSLALLKRIRDMGGPPPPAGISKREIARHAYSVAQDGRRYRLTNVENGICGVALAGNVPVRSVVSRGVQSLLDVEAGLDGTPRPQTSLFVHEAAVFCPGDPGYMFHSGRPELLPTYHLLSRFRNAITGKLYSADDLLRNVGRYPDSIGLRAPDQDGFTVESLHRVSMRMDELMVLIDNVESLVGFNVDLYNLSGDACLRDMENCMSKLSEHTKNETILGALMFSCNGRGPEAGSLIRENMADASRFARMFPTVPCLGFYAGGEIGPRALAGRQSVFQNGKSCLQGFTAVFALFIVPKADTVRLPLDDGEASIDAFIRLQSWPPST